MPDKKNWVVDIGNTRIKAGIFSQGRLLESATVTGYEALADMLQPAPQDEVLIVSVNWTEKALREKISFPFLFFDKETPLPIQNHYDSPATLGLDRLAAVIGSRAFVSGGPVLCIDLGTCITYDFMDGGDNYLGGAISPGIGLRAKAMNAFTARLPLVELGKEIPAFLGSDTRSCMKSGIYHGILGEIREYIRLFSLVHGEVTVFICGGDAEIFESLTKDHIFVIPNLVLYGLDRILTYNVEN
ncbi:type III pantothenate kinase [Cyclobacterium xiamenense]|jgi:type III pantothenate kinase|uniref:type III pantothenate kinase n=1 Tax=Cyclobacterium xiamenense TaxID=1297121 RepID=UPI0035D0C05D